MFVYLNDAFTPQYDEGLEDCSIGSGPAAAVGVPVMRVGGRRRRKRRDEEEAGAGRGCLSAAGVRVREIEGEIARALRCTVAVLYRYSDRLGFRSVCYNRCGVYRDFSLNKIYIVRFWADVDGLK